MSKKITQRLKPKTDKQRLAAIAQSVDILCDTVDRISEDVAAQRARVAVLTAEHNAKTQAARAGEKTREDTPSFNYESCMHIVCEDAGEATLLKQIVEQVRANPNISIRVEAK